MLPQRIEVPELERRIAAELRARVRELALRWKARAPSAAPGSGGPPSLEDATALLRAIVGALDGSPPDAEASVGVADLALAGWRFGARRWADGATLHQMVCETELLEAIVLYEVEQCAGQRSVAAVDAVRVARAVARAGSLVARASSKGFTHAYLSKQRDRIRMLRHDLRNPLGVIRNAIAFLGDETVPSHLRSVEKLGTLMARNASRAELLVGDALTEDGLLGPSLGVESVSLHDVALAARRMLRQEARHSDTEIAIDDDLPTIRADATAVELVLMSAVAGVLQRSRGGRVVIHADGVGPRSVRLRMTTTGEFDHETSNLDLARELAELAGGEVQVGEDVLLELPAIAGDADDDVGRSRQGEHR